MKGVASVMASKELKLFYIQSPYYWSDLYSVAESLDIETYEILVDNPTWPTEEYDRVSKAKKIRLWSEERHGSGSTPHNLPTVTLGEDGDISWIIDEIEKREGIYTNKIRNVLNYGDDVVLAVTIDSYKMIDFFRTIQTEYNLRLHYIVWRDFPTRVDDDALLLRYLPFLETAASVVICNSHDFCHPYVLSFQANDRNADWEKETKECNALFLDTAREYLKRVKQNFEGKVTTPENILLYEFGSGKTRTIKVDEIDFSNLGGCLYESITPGLNHDNCVRLKGYRDSFKKKYGVRTLPEIDENNCEYKSSCRGACKVCDAYSESMFFNSTLAHKFTNYNLVKDNELVAPINGIDRMRVNIDGNGVRSLILMDTCYLNCKYCINKNKINRFPLVYQQTVMELVAALIKDVPYFCESHGGVTFGGGEPLLYSDYIHQFHVYAPAISINLETSLNVEQKAIEALIEDVDEWIIDIKDMNSDIYYKYTGAYNDQVINNLIYLLSQVDPDRIRCRVPLIKDYNSLEDVEKSAEQLEKMGVVRIERFEYL